MTTYDNNPLAGRDVLRLMDLTPDEVALVLETAEQQKKDWKNGVRHKYYEGKSVAVILEKPSMRTRISFETAIYRLGAHPALMADSNSAFSRGETIQDTTLVLERFVDAIVIRTFEQNKVEEIANWASIPVINALTDNFHPCQVLADLLTIREHLGQLAGLKLAYVGDGNNMANTYMEGAALCGMDAIIATPADYAPPAKYIEECMEEAKKNGGSIQVITDPITALLDADIVITDTWTSMGDEEEHDQRLNIFRDYQIDLEKMALAKSSAIFMHCLPAHRGEEVTDEVMDGPQSVIFDEAENRLHAQKALLSLVLANE